MGLSLSLNFSFYKIFFHLIIINFVIIIPTTAEETEEEDYEDRNHISHSGGDDYDEIDDDEMKENLVEREIERIKRAREGEIEKRDKRREEAKRILEQFEQQNRMLEWEERKRKEGKISGRGRGRGRGRMVEGSIHRIGEDIIKVPKKRGPKPKNRPLSDDNLLTDS